MTEMVSVEVSTPVVTVEVETVLVTEVVVEETPPVLVPVLELVVVMVVTWPCTALPIIANRTINNKLALGVFICSKTEMLCRDYYHPAAFYPPPKFDHQNFITCPSSPIGKFLPKMVTLPSQSTKAQSSNSMSGTAATTVIPVQKKKFSWQNIGIGAAIQVFEVSTLGQPFEVIKTHMAGKDKIVRVIFISS